VDARYPPASTGGPCTVAEAEARQESLRAQVVTADDHPPIVTAAGLDLAYETGSDRAAAAVVVLEVATLALIDTATAVGRADFPYTPGLLAFREVPLLVEASLDGGEVIGCALRTQDGVRPVYVSVGHRVGLDTACELVLALAPRHRQPETTRQADSASRAALRRVVSEYR
jgi:deoxyribonuclease V